jgi:hypothetical protein
VVIGLVEDDVFTSPNTQKCKHESHRDRGIDPGIYSYIAKMNENKKDMKIDPRDHIRRTTTLFPNTFC